jgi:hypothetical protein
MLSAVLPVALFSGMPNALQQGSKIFLRRVIMKNAGAEAELVAQDGTGEKCFAP